MSTEEAQRLLDILSSGELSFSWKTYVLVGLITLGGAYLGAYLRRRGENFATKQDLHDITAIVEEIRARVSDESWQNQKFWEEKKTIYVELIKGLNKISDALWEHLLNGFDQQTFMGNNNPARQESAQLILNSLSRYLEYTGVAYVFLNEQAHTAMTNLSDESRRLHDELVAGQMAYAYFSDLKTAVDEAYDRMITAAKADLSAKLKKQ